MKRSKGPVIALLAASFIVSLILLNTVFGGGARGSEETARKELEDALDELQEVKKELKALKKAKGGKQKKSKTPDPTPPVQRQNYTVQVHVFTYNRLKGLKRLWKSLVGADYLGHTVPLTIFFDKKEPPRDDTENWLKTVKWPHGPFRIHRREQNTGLKKSILEAWYPTADESTFGVFFEDDIEASPLWYKWVDNALRTYAQGERNPKLLGVSLYRPIHDELTSKNMDLQTNGDPFILQQPCSWGAVYFPRPWQRFRDWYIEKGHETDPVTKGHGLPFLSSNTWSAKSSWKKYLIKYMYENGLFMVYPNTPEKTVLATNHLMKGEHPTPKRELFELPLLTQEAYDDSVGSGTDLLRAPPLASLKAYDVAVRDVGTYKGMPNYDTEF